MKTLEIISANNESLFDELVQAQRKEAHVCFSNGLQIWFNNDDGLYWGSDPYGLDFGISVEAWLPTLMSKLDYWNVDRDEHGNEIK